MDKLNATIAQAETIFLRHIKELEQLRLRAEHSGGTKPVRLGAMQAWLKGVTHIPQGRHKRIRVHATAYYRAQKIVYNPIYMKYCEERGIWDKMMLDLVLHELGHLFTHHFCNQRGHGWCWVECGEIVGYATVGSTGDATRVQYATFAAHAETIKATKDKPLGVLTKSAPSIATRPPSTVERPVDLVWRICDAYPYSSRASVIRILVQMGVNKNTAATQYSKWKKAQRGY